MGIERCKHNMLEGTCALCLGYKQTEVARPGLPRGWISEKQWHIRQGWGGQGLMEKRNAIFAQNAEREDKKRDVN